MLIIGHRGCRNLRPENTLAAIQHAFELGVDAVEFDIHLTTDNQLVINHDYHLSPNLTRTIENKWIGDIEKPLHQFSSSELKQFKFGKINPFSIYSLLRPLVKNGLDEEIPNIQDIFKLAKAYPNAKLLIEIKTTPIQPEFSSNLTRICKATVDAIQQSGLNENCMVLAFEVAVIKEIKKLSPSIATFLNQMHLKHSDSAWYSGYDLKDFNYSVPDFIKEIGATGWSSHHRQLDQLNINRAHELGLEVFAWTVNSIHRMRKLKSWGIDGIISDRPDKLLKIK